MKCPQHDIVFHAIKAHGQIIAIGFQVEQNPGTLIELSGDDLETNTDVAVMKVGDVSGDGVRKVSPRLHIVDELFVARSVNRASLLSQTAGRLTAQPRSPVKAQNALAAILDDRPVSDHAEKP